MTEYPDDDIREALAAARARQRATPRDVVSDEKADEQLLRVHDSIGQAGRVIEAGEFVPDADGMPAGVGPSTTRPILVPDLLTADQKARLDHLLAQRDNEETP